MEERKLARRDFPAFPFEPYPIQTDFMSFLYGSLDRGGVAMLESPTGTGKTLSIICSSIQWLIDQRNNPNKSSSPNKNNFDEDEPDWMRDFTLPIPEKKTTSTSKSQNKFPQKKNFTKKPEKRLIQNETKDEEEKEEEEFLLDEYESEEEGIDKLKRKAKNSLNFDSSSEEEFEEEEEIKPKIYFTSRTHSQLSQFMKEFKKTEFASKINAVCLGSRKNLCINSSVLKLGNSNRINEKCLEMQKNKNEVKIQVQNKNGNKTPKKISCKCPMLKKQNLRKIFKNEALNTTNNNNSGLDIEDLVRLGNKLGTCPYYGSRDLVRSADLIVVPYQSLLLRSARESLGLDLKGNIVIIDEAHNLADSLTAMYNSKLTFLQLKRVVSNLDSYFSRFKNILNSGNRRYIQTLIILAKSFLKLLSNSSNTSKTMTLNEFLFSLDIDNINLIKLCQYVKESNIIHKVSGYGNKISIFENNEEYETSTVSDFRSFSDVLISLMNNNSDGRIIISPQNDEKEGSLKFVMLSGDSIFSQVIKEAHSVIMAGGTLQPIEETRMRLFPNIPSENVLFFTCDHIVNRESILPLTVSSGPSGLTFDFGYSSRSSPKMIEELGRFICNIITIIPEGIVVFFSSYEYLRTVYDAWDSSNILSRISKKKHIFQEPKNSSEIDLTLKSYSESIYQSKTNSSSAISGAILFAVVGGKISEGINFGDGLGRCVVMVGLPYPSPADLELNERIKYIDGISSSGFEESQELESGFGVLRKCGSRGREYYENLCMKAVNQSIGRAIRHVNDYAAMLLVDSRYGSRSFYCPSEKLPKWIKDRLVCASSYGEVHRSLAQFFRLNKERHLK